MLDSVHFSYFATELNFASYCFLKDYAHPIQKWSLYSGESYSSYMNKVAEYFCDRFMKDLANIFTLRRRDGYRFVKLTRQGQDFEPAVNEYFQGDLWAKHIFSGSVFYLIVAEQALRETAGNDYLLDFLRISRYPQFDAPSEMPGIGPDDILRVSGLSAILKDKDIFSAVSYPVQEIIYKEIEFTISSGKEWRHPHPEPNGLDEAHDRMMAVSDEIKMPVLNKYEEIAAYWMKLLGAK